MNKKIIKVTLFLIILITICIGCEVVQPESFNILGHYKITNNLLEKTIYYETEYYDGEQFETLIKEGEIKSGESFELGLIYIEKGSLSNSVNKIKIYGDKAKEKLLYELKEKPENSLTVFKYIEEEYTMIFEMTEDKIIK